MTTHDQQTDAWANRAPQGQPQYAPEGQNYVPEDQVAPMQHDTTATHGAGRPTTPMDPQAAGIAQQHGQHTDLRQDADFRQDAARQDADLRQDAVQQRTEHTEHTQRAGHSGHESDLDGKLFADDELAGLRARWDAVQAGFVDDPKDCVQKADGLVADLVQQLTTGFGQARSRLEEQWGRGEEASTEDLRVALKRYRSFFERLLSV